jgi:hypothetical protein
LLKCNYIKKKFEHNEISQWFMYNFIFGEHLDEQGKLYPDEPSHVRTQQKKHTTQYLPLFLH